MAETTGGVAPRGDGLPARSELRASHADRDRTVELLRIAGGDGRLTADELDERVEAALEARTLGELERLTLDLPAASGVSEVAQPAKDLVRIETRSGNAQRRGRWVVPRRMEIKVGSGNVKLDFTEAVFTDPVVRVDATVRSGNLILIIAPGIVVDTDEVNVRSGNAKVRAPWGSGVATRARIEVSGQVRSGNVVARAPRRNFWEWLTRRPKRWALPRQLP
jgi:hypothetical protein